MAGELGGSIATTHLTSSNMKLTGPDASFELNILDYEYSDGSQFLDRNWLLISLRTRFKEHVFTTTAPLLSTWEVELLIDWMRALANGRRLTPKLTFVEPCLTFRCPEAPVAKALTIQLEQEAAPYWNRNDPEPFRLPVTPDPDQLRQAIEDLEAQLSKFPVRE